MNKSKFAALVFAVTGVAATAPAAAQSFYVGGSIGNNEAHQDACNGLSGCDRSDTTWSGNVGYMFTPNWGVELAYRDFGKVVEADDGVGNTAKWKTRSGEAVLVAALPIEKFSLYGKVGGYRAKTDLTSNYLTEGSSKNTQWTYGVGVRYDVMRHLGLRAEWQRYNNVGGSAIGFRADVNVISGGVVFAF
ncbi:MAG: OmpA-OmpF porin, family [Betaproteobacteria bacterium]|jgi:OOP family OmpA-OmpF porin|nr:OmpA-OmpF porin, family [Betaproteobacteria bacterium]